jgi:hypothetical protein
MNYFYIFRLLGPTKRTEEKGGRWEKPQENVAYNPHLSAFGFFFWKAFRLHCLRSKITTEDFGENLGETSGIMIKNGKSFTRRLLFGELFRSFHPEDSLHASHSILNFIRKPTLARKTMIFMKDIRHEKPSHPQLSCLQLSRQLIAQW